MKNNYPPWICADCGDKYGQRRDSVSTFHDGDKCGWCNETKPTTEPRDYGYPVHIGERDED